MKSAFRDERVIAASRTEVWSALTDWEHADRWMPGVEGMSASSPLAAGTELRYRARGKERTSRVAEVTPGTSITLTSSMPGVDAAYVYELDDTEAGTRVRLDARITTAGPMKLLGPTIRAAIAKEDGVQLARLKAWVEAPSPVA